MTERVTLGRLQVAANLQRFIEDEVLPGTGVEATAFWSGFDQLVHDLAPKNRALLAERDRLQVELDNWHRSTSWSFGVFWHIFAARCLPASQQRFNT